MVPGWLQRPAFLWRSLTEARRQEVVGSEEMEAGRPNRPPPDLGLRAGDFRPAGPTGPVLKAHRFAGLLIYSFFCRCHLTTDSSDNSSKDYYDCEHIRRINLIV